MNKCDQDFLVQKIRTQYMEKEDTALEELRRLDSRVKRPANLFAYIFGSIAALVMGSGMSLVMTDLAKYLGLSSPMVYGVIIGIVGLVMAAVNYPIYKAILKSRRKKNADMILTLSEKIMKG